MSLRREVDKLISSQKTAKELAVSQADSELQARQLFKSEALTEIRRELEPVVEVIVAALENLGNSGIFKHDSESPMSVLDYEKYDISGSMNSYALEYHRLIGFFFKNYKGSYQQGIGRGYRHWNFDDGFGVDISNAGIQIGHLRRGDRGVNVIEHFNSEGGTPYDGGFTLSDFEENFLEWILQNKSDWDDRKHGHPLNIE